MRSPKAALVLVLFVAACGGGTAASPDGNAAPTDGADSTGRLDVSFSSDVGLTGYLTTSDTSPSGAPGVLLVHQYLQNDEQWGDLPQALAERGYRVLAFNLRGHGDSDPYSGTLSNILSDPAAAPADLDAALAYLKGQGGADGDRIAIVGTSIGANLAVAAAIRNLAKTYVSFSSRKGPAETFAGAAATGMKSVFYLAGENDAGDQAADGQSMYELSSEPRMIKVYAGVADHGISILNNQADARGLLLDWLTANL